VGLRQEFSGSRGSDWRSVLYKIFCSVSNRSPAGFRNSCSRIMAEVMKPGMKHETDFSIRGSNPEVGTRSGPDGNSRSESSMVLVLLNYRLPRYTPLLWSQGN